MEFTVDCLKVVNVSVFWNVIKTDINVLTEPSDEPDKNTKPTKNASFYEKLTTQSLNPNSIIEENHIENCYNSFMSGNLPSNYSSRTESKRYCNYIFFFNLDINKYPDLKKELNNNFV